MDPTCGLVDKIRDLVYDQIWKQLLYLVHYHENIEQLYGRLDALIGQRSTLQRRIDEATNNADKIDENVLQWFPRVDEISKQVQQLHRECGAKSEGCITSCPNPWLRYKLSKRAEAIANEAVEICGGGNFVIVSYRDPPPPMREFRNEGSNEGIGSRVPILNQIMEALRNSSVNMIGLCGPGGVGKTIIAEEVAKKGMNQKMFKKVIKATVSKELNVEKIQGQITDMLGMEHNQRSDTGRADLICKRLKEEKEMLIILDNVWEELDLDKIGIPFKVEQASKTNDKTNESCKILLTSRDKALLLGMKCQKIIDVGVLSDDEALELFKKIAELSNRPQWISIATEIVQKCGGLPLAIAVAAKALKNKARDEWEDACKRLSNPLRRNITLTKEVDAVLKLSYDHLSSSEYKRVFLLAALLSRDLSIEDLLMYSLGLNIITHTQNMEEARNGFSVIVRKLKSLDLFLDGFSSHHVTMHDFFRDFAVFTASEEELHAFRMVKKWPDDNIPEDCKGICLQECDITGIPEELHRPKLEFLLLKSTKRDLTVPNEFFKSSKELRLLAFTNVHFRSLQLLSFLQKLKALCLHSCLLEDITEVGSLKKLKILSLAHSEIQRLPIELAELTSLQMLNLSHCSKLKVIPQNLLCRLKKLEVLYIRNSFDQWKVEESSEANENASLDELMDLPISSLDIQIPNVSMMPENLFLRMNLRRYKIFIGKHWKRQGNYETSKILRLELESSIHLNHLKRGIGKLLEGVEDLHLYGSNWLENVLYNRGVGGFSRLRHLQIESNDEIKYVVLNSAYHEDAFPILESLELKNLKALENLCQGPNDIVFHQLHTLKMENLPALTTDFCIKDSATRNASNKIFKSLFNKKVLLPRLEILELSNLLETLIPLIWDDQISHNSFNNLKVLIVKKCGFVKLVPLHVLKSLNKLEEVEVEDCAMLEMVFDFEDLNDYYKEVGSSSVVVPLKKLKLESLPELKNVWSNNYQGNISFPSLRRIDVSYCKSLTSIFPSLSTAKGILEELEELRVSGCDIDVIVAKDQVSESVAAPLQFPRLTSLKLYCLPRLTSFYPERRTLEWPHLQRLSIEYCDKLEIFEKRTLDSRYPLFSHKVVQNLEELDLGGEPAQMIGSGRFPMYHFPTVKLLHLYAQNATTISYGTLLKSFPNLKELKLSGDFAKAFGGDDVAALESPFPKLILYIIRITGSLSPLLVSSPNLTHIEVICCDDLTALMTSSTARNLVHLTHLTIGRCNKIEEIITKQEGENDEDKEIIFNKLKILVLDDLRGLKKFCGYNYTIRFPLLVQLVIKECPSCKIFSAGLIDTPLLKSIQLSQDGEKQHEVWDADLNRAFYQQQLMVSWKLVLDEDDAIMIRNDQFPANHYPQVEILRIERFVDERITFPYTLLERFPKLNFLQVWYSSFEEIFPPHAHIVDQIPPFKELSLYNLHQLKIIWKDDSQLWPVQNLEILDVENCSNLIKLAPSSTSFDNLKEMKVSKCHQLIYLVTCSTARSLMNLKTLEIDDCEKLEEIIKKEPNEDVESGITFNQLQKIKLTDMPSLKMFSSQSHTFKFPELEKIKITGCPEMKMFCQGVLETPKLSKVKIEEHDMEWKDGDLNKTLEMLSSAN